MIVAGAIQLLYVVVDVDVEHLLFFKLVSSGNPHDP